jgi:hypothetical protein
MTRRNQHYPQSPSPPRPGCCSTDSCRTKRTPTRVERPQQARDGIAAA